MFKNATIYRLGAAWAPNLHAVEEAAIKARFTSCGPTQQKSIGFVPPRAVDERSALVESIGGQWVMRIMSETRSVPGQVLKRRVDEIAEQIEQQTGRKPGKKQKKELKEQALLELLPMAFTKVATTWVWIDPARRLLVIDTASAGRSDDIVTVLVKAIDGMAVSLVQTQLSPASVMTSWLHDGDKLDTEDRFGFDLDRECELKSTDELRSVVRYGKHPLDVDNVREHITGGKVATKLALTWRGRVSFVLTEALQLRKLSFLDVVFEGDDSKDADALEADVAIMTGELVKLLPELVEALGGELVGEQAQQAEQGDQHGADSPWDA